MTPLPIHEVTVHAGPRSLTLFFREPPSPAQIIEAIEAREGAWTDQPHFQRLLKWVREMKYVSVKREMWGNGVEETK